MKDVITDYINLFDGIKKSMLIQMRDIIRKAAPDAVEKISYKMPTFYLNGNLVHFAAQKNHLGFYPGGEGVKQFEHKLTSYQFSKGAIQFPYDKPLPENLIIEIVLFRVSQNQK